MRSIVLLLAVLLLGGCAAELEHDESAVEDPNAPIQTLDQDGDVITTQVDAQSDAKWIYMDLESNEEVTPDDPDDDESWDIAFQRFEIKLNGGVSGSGGVEVEVLEDAFDDVDVGPESGFITDGEDSEEDENDKPDLAFGSGDTGWYDYNVTNHTLSPRAFTYVLKTVEGGFYKLAILDYYDDAGTSGFMTLQWAPLED